MNKLLKERPRKLVRSAIVLCIVAILLYLVSLLAWASPRDPASVAPQSYELKRLQVATLTVTPGGPTETPSGGTATATATLVSTEPTATHTPNGEATATGTSAQPTPTPSATTNVTPMPTLSGDRIRLQVAVEADYAALQSSQYFTVRVDVGDGDPLDYYFREIQKVIGVDYLSTTMTISIQQIDLPSGWVQEGGISCTIDGNLGSNPLRLVGGQTGICSLRNVGPPPTATTEPGTVTSTATPTPIDTFTPTQIPPGPSPTGSLTPTPITPVPTVDPNATATIGPSPTPGGGSQTPQPTATSQGGSQTPQPTLTPVGSPTPGGGTPVPNPTSGTPGGSATPPNGSPVPSPSPTLGTPQATRAVMLPLIQK